jgi:methyl-accepting chemotaxis protein
LKAGFIMAALADTIPIGIGKAESIQEIEDHLAKADGSERESAKDSSIWTVLAEWNKICARIELFTDEFSKLGKGEEKSRESITATVLRIHEAIRDTDARASLLVSSIGTDDTSASGEGAESVWDTIRRVCNTLDEIQGLVDDCSQEIREVTGQVTKFQEKMANMSRNLLGLKQYVVDSLSVIHWKVRNLESSSPGGGSGMQEAGISNLALDRLKGRLLEEWEIREK